MDLHATSKITVDVPVHATGMTSITQYGMRYPDDTVVWVWEQDPRGDTHFVDLANGNYSATYNFTNRLKKRAESARLDVDQYIAEHQLLKRTIFVGTTDAEDVPMPKGIITNDSWK